MCNRLRRPNRHRRTSAIDSLDEAINAVVSAAGAGLSDDVGDAERVVGVEGAAVGGDGALVLRDGRVGALEGHGHVLYGSVLWGGGSGGAFPGVGGCGSADEGNGGEADGFVHFCEGWCWIGSAGWLFWLVVGCGGVGGWCVEDVV
jgi:hypothetical protein